MQHGWIKLIKSDNKRIHNVTKELFIKESKKTNALISQKYESV